VPVPTARLAAVAAALAVAVVVLPDPGVALLGANGLLLAAAAVDWARAIRPETLPVVRTLPAIVALDGEAEVAWTVANPTGRRVRVHLADDLAPSLRAGTRRARLDVPPGRRAIARTTIRPARRGRFDPASVTVRVQGPWGLVARQGVVPVASTVRVYPPFHSRDEAELRVTRARILEVGLRSARGRGGGTEFEQLREYGPDDESRKIDWAATARLGKPLVRTYRAERNQTVLVLLDSGRTMAGRVADVPRLDHALDAVMTAVTVSTRLGDRAGLVAFADAVRAVVPPGHTRDQLSRVTAAIYGLEPVLAESDYRGAFAETLARFRRRALLVLLTELAAQTLTDTLLPALPLVSRSHIVIVGAVRDPATAAWARSTPESAEEAYRKAAAVQALAERRRTVGQLRGLGAVVVDEEPGRLAPALADAYLDVKATGRL
jgi:uncharacterized protein (DUF58 family)